MPHRASTALLGLAVAACTQTAQATYSPPEASGLVSVRPFPAEGDVCQVIGESAATADYLDDSAVLIGCPVQEAGAIADRRAEGATELEVIGSWLLLSVPG
jgi:hypothetical protein